MASEYTLVTDSSCDMPLNWLAENGVVTMQLSFTIGDRTWKCNEMSPKEFYDRIRSGSQPISAQVNVDDALGFFEPLLQAGQDILYIAFSSGLSGTCNSGQIAAAELSARYPERKIMVVDSLCASMGQGLLVYLVNERKRNGATLAEAARWAEDNALRVTHYVTVDDLMHLHRGGRVSKTSAVMGSVLGIKPMIYMDNAGKLVVISKSRGRKTALADTVKRMAVAVGDTDPEYCFISHADCEEDARYVEELVKKQLGVRKTMIHYVGPVIGAHTGPGCIAMFMMGKHR